MINVRIITSSCEDILRLVREGRFRGDLFYRLNVISLSVPSLRERRSDIPLLFRHYQRRLDADFKLTARARQAVIQHRWEGNVQELINCVEYLHYTGLQMIDLDDLPQSIRASREQSEQREELVHGSGLTRQEFLVLRELGENYREKKGLGRRTIVERCAARGAVEHETRSALIKLAGLGYADVQTGRGGSRLTEQGYLQYRNIVYGDEAAHSWT